MQAQKVGVRDFTKKHAITEKQDIPERSVSEGLQIVGANGHRECWEFVES